MTSYIFPGLFLFAGALFLTIAWRSGRETLLILKNGVKTQGIVIENALRARRVGDKTAPTAMAPVVQFKTEQDEVITYYSQDYINPPLYNVGQMVDIWYLSDDPKTASLNGKEIWILPGVFGVFGLVAFLIGLGLLFSRKS